jgi:hypothetical protein
VSSDKVKVEDVCVSVASKSESVSARVEQRDVDGVTVFVCLVCDKVLSSRSHCEHT